MVRIGLCTKRRSACCCQKPATAPGLKNKKKKNAPAGGRIRECRSFIIDSEVSPQGLRNFLFFVVVFLFSNALDMLIARPTRFPKRAKTQNHNGGTTLNSPNNDDPVGISTSSRSRHCPHHRKTPPLMPYSSGRPVGNSASKLQRQKGYHQGGRPDPLL